MIFDLIQAIGEAHRFWTSWYLTTLQGACSTSDGLMLLWVYIMHYRNNSDFGLESIPWHYL